MNQDTASTRRPNILWICTDSQRWDTLGCTGNPYVQTPHLDRLATEGVVFSQCYCQSPFCMPSRASFMTGRYPRTTRCRQNGQTLPADEVLVSRVLADAGYLCGMVGRLHVSAGFWGERRVDDGYAAWHYSPVPFPDWREEYDHAAVNEYTLWLRERGVTDFESYIWYPDKPSPRAVMGSRYVQAGPDPELHQTTWCANRAMAFIEGNANLDAPWMLTLNPIAPHHPFDPPMEYLERYLKNLDAVPLPNYAPGELDRQNELHRLAHDGAYNVPGLFRYDDMSDRDHRLVRAAYWAQVDLIDAQVGRILESLQKTGQIDDTMIVFSSDHGEMLGDHGIYLKGPFFYDPLVRVPLAMSWPGRVQPRGQCPALVEMVDVVPTLLDAAGLTHPPGIQGRSLWPLLRGVEHDATHREDVYSEFYNASKMFRDPPVYLTMVRSDRWKLVVQHGAHDGELYDMDQDPSETRNLWNDDGHLAIRSEMLLRLCDRMAWTVDPLPLREQRF